MRARRSPAIAARVARHGWRATRRCKHIVVIDASADPECRFDDLGNAIRKIRIDLGVPIEFDGPLQIHPRDEQLAADAKRHYWAVAKVRYSCVDSQPGTATTESG